MHDIAAMVVLLVVLLAIYWLFYGAAHWEMV